MTVCKPTAEIGFITGGLMAGTGMLLESLREMNWIHRTGVVLR
jgi:hypothetical protein